MSSGSNAGPAKRRCRRPARPLRAQQVRRAPRRRGRAGTPLSRRPASRPTAAPVPSAPSARRATRPAPDRAAPRPRGRPADSASLAADGAVGRNLQAAVERAADHLRRDADAVRRREHRRDLVAVAGVLDERRRLRRARAPAAAARRDSRRAQRLRTASTFSAARARISRDEMQDEADAEIDRDRIPRRADAEAVDVPVGEALHHVGRRQHDEAHVLVRIDAARRHPEAQMIIVRRERERHAEGERLRRRAPCGCATTRASARADTIGSVMSPSAASAIAA